jgi:hypothetical protein
VKASLLTSIRKNKYKPPFSKNSEPWKIKKQIYLYSCEQVDQAPWEYRNGECPYLPPSYFGPVARQNTNP